MTSAGALFSSFACAACCALPVLLSSLGLTGAWTLQLQLLTGPYARVWFWATVILLLLSGWLWARDVRRVRRAKGILTPALAIAPAVLLLAVMVFAITATAEPGFLSALL